ncbi:hypothetical protein PR048_015015 [Dryococelus australis]|uniref:PiggyBac transposable element-derived protein domain-containing protein n=1 Tax=Dryococelus australis TaxID=614101 RepID=A0ABQ9HFW6_9NEOP|nr:hypothetical protein PR048_015015 [Dryococelus australis]
MIQIPNLKKDNVGGRYGHTVSISNIPLSSDADTATGVQNNNNIASATAVHACEIKIFEKKKKERKKLLYLEFCATRCHILPQAMRFYDKSTSLVCAENDPAAPISDNYKVKMKNFMSNYSIGAFACDDATLKPTQALIRLTRNLNNTHRNITCDNWFTSIEAVEWLWKNGLTLTGTLRGNKPQIPAEFLPQKYRPVNSSLYGFTEELTLVSFVPKMLKLALSLINDHLQERLSIPNLTSNLRDFISDALGIDEASPSQSTTLENYKLEKRKKLLLLSLSIEQDDIIQICKL